jgi:hypothetical protein
VIESSSVEDAALVSEYEAAYMAWLRRRELGPWWRRPWVE